MFQGCDPEGKYPELLEKKPFKYVSAAILVDEDNKILISKRPKGKDMQGFWEFPGGKIEENEVPEICLVRELQEELGIKTSAGCMSPLTFLSHRYDNFHLIMFVFICRKWVGIPQGMEGQSLKWIKRFDLVKYDMPAANIPLISAVRDML